MAGKVYLIGGGPGDPGLLTLRGRAVLSRADVVVYDFLANETLLQHVPEDAEIIFLGKRGGGSTRAQAEINRLMIDRARQGKCVARLKGGDPCVFGRGGEEALALVEAGIPFEIVPGVTSALAVPLYAGIPVTYRDLSSSVSLVTGHEDAAKEDTAIDWARVAPSRGTLIILMGTARLQEIAAALVDNGRDPQTPAAIIRWGTRASQKTVEAPLSRIAEAARNEDIKPPTVLVVGEVVNLREKLQWFENKPLFGRRILVTRARAQASRFTELLQEEGAEVISFPVIAFCEPSDPAPLESAIRGLDTYDGVLFTSANAVDRFFDRAGTLQRDARALSGKIVGAIGLETSATLARHGIRADVMPEKFVAEDFAAALSAHTALKGKRFLLPRAREAREALPEALAAAGARCDVVEAYSTVVPAGAEKRLAEILRAGAVDMLTFTASSTLRNFVSLLPEEEREALLAGKVVACIGPITAQTAQEAGLEVDVVAQEHTAGGLARAILDYYKTGSGG